LDWSDGANSGHPDDNVASVDKRHEQHFDGANYGGKWVDDNVVSVDAPYGGKRHDFDNIVVDPAHDKWHDVNDP
jgi:hypothetical protein